MHLRHRTPTLFSLSMVDVLCCALGCVILLWLLNLREARDRATTVGATSALLADSREEVARLQARLASLEREQAASREHAEAVARQLTAARERIRELDQQAGRLREQAAAARDNETAAAERLARLTREKTSLEERLSGLLAAARDKEAAAALAARRLEELSRQLQEAEAQAKQAREQADRAAQLQTEVQEAQKRLGMLEQTLRRRDQELAESHRRADGLAEETRRAKAAIANRFEGIELNGRRVVFVVDMSGSMQLVDEQTISPEKWAGVCDTLVRLLRSLSRLEKFQVLLFSDQVLFPLGEAERLLDFDLQTTPERVGQTLAAIKPRGNTDMHAGLKAAFRFRDQGMDTVYLLSDGLPNIGEGLPAGVPLSQLGEAERGDILGKYVRKKLRDEWNAPQLNRPRVRIHTLGFFYETPQVGAFLWALARENDGSFVGMSKP